MPGCLVASWLITACIVAASHARLPPQIVACLLTVAAWRCLVDAWLLPSCCLVDAWLLPSNCLVDVQYFLVFKLLTCFCLFVSFPLSGCCLELPGRCLELPGCCLELPSCCLELPGCCLELPSCCLELPGCCLVLPGCCLELPGCCLELPGWCLVLHGCCQLLPVWCLFSAWSLPGFPRLLPGCFMTVAWLMPNYCLAFCLVMTIWHNYTYA